MVTVVSRVLKVSGPFWVLLGSDIGGSELNRTCFDWILVIAEFGDSTISWFLRATSFARRGFLLDESAKCLVVDWEGWMFPKSNWAPSSVECALFLENVGAALSVISPADGKGGRRKRNETEVASLPFQRVIISVAITFRSPSGLTLSWFVNALY